MQTSLIWDILVNCASTKQVIDEKTLLGMLGIGREELLQALEPIRAYCHENNLLPLYLLVVNEQEASGEGKDEQHINCLGQLYFWILNYDWESLPAPTWHD